MRIIINLKEQVSQTFDATRIEWTIETLHIETIEGEPIDIEVNTIVDFNIETL